MNWTKKDILDLIGAIFAAAIFALLFVLFVWGTPDQMSAEYDLAATAQEGGR